MGGMNNTTLPTSIDDTEARLLALDYVPERALATTVYLALKLQRPLFLEGEPGTGKTEIAKTLADHAGPAADPAAMPRGPGPGGRGL